MEIATTVKRPRGRPRSSAPPRPAVHLRLPHELKMQLERDAKRTNRSLPKEIASRLNESYVSDENYGGPQMATLFREMAAVASGVERQKKRGSCFDDFETFVFVKDVWQRIIQREMPRPDDQLLTQLSQRWDDFRVGTPQTPAEQAAREWLIQHSPMTLALALAGTPGAAATESLEPRETASDKPAKTTGAAAIGESRISRRNR
jgi:hypothetical protein